MIPQSRQKQYNEFVAEATYNVYYYELYKVQWQGLFDYLSGHDVPIPTFPEPNHAWAVSKLLDLLENPQNWVLFDERIMAFFEIWWQRPEIYLSKNQFAEIWSYRLISAQNDIATVEGLVRVFRQYQIDETIFAIYNFRFIFDENKNVTALGQYVLRTAKNILTKIKDDNEHIVSFFHLLLKHNEPLLEQNLVVFMRPNRASFWATETFVPLLLAQNAVKYEPFLVEILDAINLKAETNESKFMQAIILLERLANYFPEKYNNRCLELCHEYVALLQANFATQHYSFGFDTNQGNYFYLFSNRIFNIFFEKMPYSEAFSFVHDFLKKSSHVINKTLDYLSARLGQKSIPILVDLLAKTEVDNTESHDSIYKYLKDVPHEEFYPQIWALTQHLSKKTRLQAATHLAKMQGEAAIPNAQKLLGDKKGELRLVGAVLLSQIKTENALNILKATLDTETNDDARDAILEDITGILPPINDVEASKTLILKAKSRKKLDKPLTAWLNTEGVGFPKLYWTNGVQLQNDEIQFLFYRMNRTKDIRIEMEVQPIIALIDKAKSGDFAKFLIKKYFENGAEPKLKWCMTLAAMLGGFDVIDLLKRKIDEWVTVKRGKMAELAITALALNGSTKALRAVEVFSRKYKNKAPNIGTAANAAFTLVAEQLGISRYDLADMIIPDFDFEGLFREFEVGGETYRAFINNDFKLVFLNEDNRLLKTLPKGTPPQLKEEFKEIAKEVRDIVKSQSSRLEQYLVIQRKWSLEKWDAFFRGNPIMFAYAVRLIWGIFDEKQNLIGTFQCLEDQTLVNMEGDELDFDDFGMGNSDFGEDESKSEIPIPTYSIAMIHPMQLDEEQINHWKTALYDAGVQPLFPQLDRPVVRLKEADKDTTISEEFKGIKYSGYAFVSKIEKSGWLRDNGRVYTYYSHYKDFVDLGITAVLTQANYFSLSDPNAEAELSELMFLKRKSIDATTSTYAEPETSARNGFIPFGKLPPIVYSEVMGDMMFFKENQIKK
jgi:Domain of unknown function (DUF4132)/HEAT repeats